MARLDYEVCEDFVEDGDGGGKVRGAGAVGVEEVAEVGLQEGRAAGAAGAVVGAAWARAGFGHRGF